MGQLNAFEQGFQQAVEESVQQITNSNVWQAFEDAQKQLKCGGGGDGSKGGGGGCGGGSLGGIDGGPGSASGIARNELRGL